jgi:hypothetical protein
MKRVSHVLCLLFVTSGLALAQTTSNRSLATGHPGAYLEARGRVIVAFPIENRSRDTVEAVRVTAVKFGPGRMATPQKLPVELGAIAPGEDATLYATFSGRSFRAGRSYSLTVSGTYGNGTKFSLTQVIKLPPASPGSAKAKQASTQPKKVSGGRYPPMERHEEEMNEFPARKVPRSTVGRPARQSRETKAIPSPKVGTSGVSLDTGNWLTMSSRPEIEPILSPYVVTFRTNAGLGINGNSIAEPSGAVGGRVVFVTANAYAAFSTNNGASFTQLTPSTIFPNTADGGFCCDQVVQYVPSIDRFVWLMQFSRATDARGNVRNRYRLAAASPATIISSSGTAWTYWDFTTGLIGITNGWIDYPDLSVGTRSLYLSYDRVGTGLAVIRMPLSQIQAGSTINFWYTDPSLGGVAYGSHLTQNPQEEIFWAGHNSTSSMRIFSWQEGSSTYFWRDRSIGSWSNSAMMSSSPDSRDWLTKLRDFPGNAVLGSTRVRSGQNDRIWFAWTAGPGGNFGQPHVQWVSMDRNNNYNLVSQSQIWNNAYAFAYPALSVNSDAEVGLSLEYGGASNYENHVVGFWGDFLVYTTASSNVGTTRFGDYVTIRQNSADRRLFDAFGYGLTSGAGGGTVTDTRFVQFGR